MILPCCYLFSKAPTIEMTLVTSVKIPEQSSASFEIFSYTNYRWSSPMGRLDEETGQWDSQELRLKPLRGQQERNLLMLPVSSKKRRRDRTCGWSCWGCALQGWRGLSFTVVLWEVVALSCRGAVVVPLCRLSPEAVACRQEVSVSSGVITTTRSFDREEQKEHTLSVTATDQAPEPLIGICQITVLIADVNDNDPKFENSRYQCEWLVNHLSQCCNTNLFSSS